MVEKGSKVCSMCGDIGFPNKIFQCLHCLYRFQHSYCSNYYCDNSAESFAGVCDWCRNDDCSFTRSCRNPAGCNHRDKPAARQSSDHDDQSSGSGSRGRGSASPSSSNSSAKHIGRRSNIPKDAGRSTNIVDVSEDLLLGKLDFDDDYIDDELDPAIKEELDMSASLNFSIFCAFLLKGFFCSALLICLETLYSCFLA
ncbi:SKP1-like protein 21 [Platanthera guangdongensis]|uniref:SKP1-like protein 21 n=1 Tax=Platanthera guangdongensis TaxID=2320717 RepID=A0ABR2M9S1_9ASPA